MNKKYFVINETPQFSKTEDIEQIEKVKSTALNNGYGSKLSLTEKRKETEQVRLKHVYGRIIIKIDIDLKNSHTFQDGTKIFIDRQVKNLNRRETEPINAIVVDAEYIPADSEILIHPNSIVDANKIFNYSTDLNVEAGNSIRYYSIEETSAFIYRENNEWKPLKNFATALRVFKPYEGRLASITPNQLKNILYITSGEYKGFVCHTLIAADYELIFMGKDGREERIIRCRNYEDGWNDRQELIAIDYNLTEQVNNGFLKIGLSNSDCKTLKEYYG